MSPTKKTNTVQSSACTGCLLALNKPKYVDHIRLGAVF